MLISTRGRYALRVMIDLAEHQGEGFIPLKAIALPCPALSLTPKPVPARRNAARFPYGKGWTRSSTTIWITSPWPT